MGKNVEDQLKEMITSKLRDEAQQKNRSAMAQFVFCIDVRSEPFRRKLEESGPFKTLAQLDFLDYQLKLASLGVTPSPFFTGHV